MTSGWEERKLEAWARLWEDLEIGYLDEDILPVLLEFFARPKSFPQSSCSGRLVVMDVDVPWRKEETMIVFKRHVPVSAEEILRVLEKRCAHAFWLSVQGPIYHVCALDLKEALELLALAREAGFKHSGIIVVNESGLLLELRTGIRINVPLKLGNRVLLDRDSVREVVELANNVLRHAKERNERLLSVLRTRRPEELWPPAAEKLEMLYGQRG